MGYCGYAPDGQFVAIELKLNAKDQLSEEQRAFGDDVRIAGITWVIRDFPVFSEWFLRQSIENRGDGYGPGKSVGRSPSAKGGCFFLKLKKHGSKTKRVPVSRDRSRMYRLCYRLRKLGVEVPHRMRRIEVQDEEEIKPVKVSAVVYSLISEYNFSVQFRILDAEGQGHRRFGKGPCRACVDTAHSI